ncbi:hypothetical protein, partial [Dysgonomonas capnocytophagoides]|uniref:hypothetical protein n=1 Tax=Dysgonomonas capnocytophagoides TaxID=45254 RepID=UPI002A7FDD1F
KSPVGLYSDRGHFYFGEKGQTYFGTWGQFRLARGGNAHWIFQKPLIGYLCFFYIFCNIHTL